MSKGGEKVVITWNIQRGHSIRSLEEEEEDDMVGNQDSGGEEEEECSQIIVKDIQFLVFKHSFVRSVAGMSKDKKLGMNMVISAAGPENEYGYDIHIILM